MEKRPLSKLAVASLILSIVSIISVILIIIILEFSISLGFPFTLILIVPIIVIPAIIIGIVAQRRIKQYDLRGKALIIIGNILSVITILCYGWFLWTEVIDRGGGGGCGNEGSAAAALKLLASAEAAWAQQDCDGNGIKDYWTYDVSCLHRMLRSNYSIKVAFIPIDLARADMAPASMAGGVTPFGTPKIESWLEMTLEPKSGCCFMAMLSDENGIPYNQNPVGPNKIPATNSRKYAFVAYPAVYDISGINTFIVNQEGTIYARNMGRDDRKIVLRWPDANEMKKWRIAD